MKTQKENKYENGLAGTAKQDREMQNNQKTRLVWWLVMVESAVTSRTGNVQLFLVYAGENESVFCAYDVTAVDE